MAIANDSRPYLERWFEAISSPTAASNPYGGRIALNRPRHFPSKVVALTFDDGPSPEVTPRILDTLAQYKAKATFFVMGRWAEKYPELVRRIVSEGHAIGNHSYSHPSSTTPEGARREIESTNSIIQQITGSRPTIFRPPYGIQNGELARYAKRAGMAVVIWNLTSADTATKDAKVIAHNVAYTPNPGDIALMHDGIGHGPTADALPSILEKLTADHFEFVTVPDVLRQWHAFAVRPQPSLDRHHTMIASRSKQIRRKK